ncbi:hypothetical protein C0J52_20467 [Blattella germanica]|nr:hypothetical protein C0J52_20467 [Blattella germanica]
MKCYFRSVQFIQTVRKFDLVKTGTGLGYVLHNHGGSLRTQIFLNTRSYSRLFKTDRKLSGISKFIFQNNMKTSEEFIDRLGVACISSQSVKTKFYNVVAYATAEEYDLEKLIKGLLEQNLYKPVRKLKSSERTQVDVLHVTARYEVGDEPREIYFFREGTTVFWNMPELETSNVLSFIRQFEENSYDERLVQDESEVMPYTHATGKNSHLDTGDIVLGDEGNKELDKYTFANAMALSVKLGIWEASLNRYVDSIEYVTEDLKRGTKIGMSQDDVLRKTGELFALRHVINLSSDLLDTPDFYWDHEEQENLYQQMCAYFSIGRRTRVMNERLSHCLELVELLSTHLSDKHHTRLEWMIIILIMVEVGFEIIHYVDRYM